MAYHARSGRVPAIMGRMAARTAQAPKPRAEPVADADIDQLRPTQEAQPINARLPRHEATRGSGIELMPRGPHQASPVPTLRVVLVWVISHDAILPCGCRCAMNGSATCQRTSQGRELLDLSGASALELPDADVELPCG